MTPLTWVSCDLDWWQMFNVQRSSDVEKFLLFLCWLPSIHRRVWSLTPLSMVTPIRLLHIQYYRSHRMTAFQVSGQFNPRSRIDWAVANWHDVCLHKTSGAAPHVTELQYSTPNRENMREVLTDLSMWCLVPLENLIRNALGSDDGSESQACK